MAMLIAHLGILVALLRITHQRKPRGDRWNKMGVSPEQPTYPDCADAASYIPYGKSTHYKGIHDDTAWDRKRRTGEDCAFAPSPDAKAVPQTKTCGDCDALLLPGKWIRFDTGPYVMIKEFPGIEESYCPFKGHCNGLFQLTLIPAEVASEHDRVTLFRVVTSYRNSESNCSEIASVSHSLVEKFECEDFVLYRLYPGWQEFGARCLQRIRTHDGYVKAPSPVSFCMEDTVFSLTLTANKRYVVSGVKEEDEEEEEEEPLVCTSSQSPKPNNITIVWKDGGGNDLSSLATQNRNASNLLTKVYTLKSSSFLAHGSSVMCQVGSKSHTFTGVSLLVDNSTIGRIVFTIVFSDRFSENKKNIRLHQRLEDSEVEMTYTTQNFSDSGLITAKKISAVMCQITVMSSEDQSGVGLWRAGIFDPISQKTHTTPWIHLITKSLTSQKIQTDAWTPLDASPPITPRRPQYHKWYFVGCSVVIACCVCTVGLYQIVKKLRKEDNKDTPQTNVSVIFKQVFSDEQPAAEHEYQVAEE